MSGFCGTPRLFLDVERNDLARWLKPWSKKRGDRRSGSPLLGSVGEALMFATLFLTATLTLVVILTSIQQRCWPATTYFPESYCIQTVCRVMDKQFGPISRDAPPERYGTRLLVAVDYGDRVVRQWISQDIATMNRVASEEELNRFSVGMDVPCWYDPTRRANVTLQRPSRLELWLVLSVLASFMGIGSIGVLYTVLSVGTSAERRSALAKKAGDIELIRESASAPPDYPGVPSTVEMSNSPGVVLAYRLPIARSPGWRLFGAVLFCLVWNSIATVFVVVALKSHVAGKPEWLLTAVTLPFMGVGVWSIYYFMRQLLMTIGIGTTGMEISDHPLFPGQSYQVLVTQSGRLQLRLLELMLVCDEEATYRQGTDIRTEGGRVYSQQVFRWENVDIKPGAPFESECTLTVPRSLMHSFQSAHNTVQWQLVIKGEAQGWPEYERGFPLVVYPAQDGKTERRDGTTN